MENTIFNDLDDVTKAVCAGWFSGMGATGTLRFGMKKARPAKVAQEALNTLVSKNIISRTDEEDGSVVYKPVADCSVLRSWLQANCEREDLRFPLVEQIGNDPVQMILELKDADPRVVAIYEHYDEVSQFSRAQSDLFHSTLADWEFFKQKKKVDNVYRDKLRSLVIKALKKVRDTKFVD